jgi:polyhydroxyalkanoate synthase
MASFTGGISPISLALAGFDWWSHLLSSPDKILNLHESLWKKSLQLQNYALKAPYSERGTPEQETSPSDHRFKDPSWDDWPFSVFQYAFLLTQDWWKEAACNVRGVSHHHLNVSAFAIRQWLDIFSPSNHPLTNPVILKTTFEEKGQNFFYGMINWLEDIKRTVTGQPPVGFEAFKLGENLATTKGKVIYRNELIELIQYAPTTSEVYREPILIIPAWIMKYYILDLSPHNSLVQHLIKKGHTVFIISWKNPNSSDRHLSFEHYLHYGIEESLQAIRAITSTPHVHGIGYCLGGTLLAIAAAAYARDGNTSLKTLTLLAAQVDFEEAGELMLFIDESQVAYLEDLMWDKGYLDKSQMAGAFQMLRSNDLIWSRIVMEYMRGKRQPVFDLLVWNADATRMPYQMHSQYLRQLFLKNDLAEGHFKVGKAPVALKDIHLPIFAVGTTQDHIAPWRSVYKIGLFTQSDMTFILAKGGHNAGIVSEPGHKGRTYQVSVMLNTDQHVPPDLWQKNAPEKLGSWWEEWQTWLAAHSTGTQAPPPMGNDSTYSPITDAPGTYVFMK